MKCFVIHYPKLTERRERLEKEFERLGMTDVEWVTHWNKEDEFVQCVKDYVHSPIGLGHMSAFLKRCWCYNKMITENIPEAFIFEDDVVFSKEFELMEIPKEADYLRLGTGISNKPYSTEIHIVLNPGGGEAAYATQNFAKYFLDRLSFECPHDIVESAVIGYDFSTYIPYIRGIPVCSQFGYETSCEETSDKFNWMPVYQNYHLLPKYNWNDILKKFSELL